MLVGLWWLSVAAQPRACCDEARLFRGTAESVAQDYVNDHLVGTASTPIRQGPDPMYPELIDITFGISRAAQWANVGPPPAVQVQPLDALEPGDLLIVEVQKIGSDHLGAIRVRITPAPRPAPASNPSVANDRPAA